jgi:hypothetical protein
VSVADPRRSIRMRPSVDAGAVVRRPVALARVLALSPIQRSMLRHAFPVVLGVRMALWFVPVRRILGYAAARSASADRTSPNAVLSAASIAWSVRVVSRRIPGASCLTQAISGQILLARQGIPTTLHLGMARSPEEGMRAHAWLDCQGQTVLGGQVAGQYARFPGLDTVLGRDAAAVSSLRERR